MPCLCRAVPISLEAACGCVFFFGPPPFFFRRHSVRISIVLGGVLFLETNPCLPQHRFISRKSSSRCNTGPLFHCRAQARSTVTAWQASCKVQREQTRAFFQGTGFGVSKGFPLSTKRKPRFWGSPISRPTQLDENVPIASFVVFKSRFLSRAFRFQSTWKGIPCSLYSCIPSSLEDVLS